MGLLPPVTSLETSMAPFSLMRCSSSSRTSSSSGWMYLLLGGWGSRLCWKAEKGGGLGQGRQAQMSADGPTTLSLLPISTGWGWRMVSLSHRSHLLADLTQDGGLQGHSLEQCAHHTALLPGLQLTQLLQRDTTAWAWGWGHRLSMLRPCPALGPLPGPHGRVNIKRAGPPQAGDRPGWVRPCKDSAVCAVATTGNVQSHPDEAGRILPQSLREPVLLIPTSGL